MGGPRHRKSRVLAQVEVKRAQFAAVSPTLDLGKGYGLTDYDHKIEEVRAKLNTYNGLLATAHAMSDEIWAAEKGLVRYSRNMIALLAVKFGQDSPEYEKAGGSLGGRRKRATPEAPAEAPKEAARPGA